MHQTLTSAIETLEVLMYYIIDVDARILAQLEIDSLKAQRDRLGMKEVA